jgi:hypothetical protein
LPRQSPSPYPCRPPPQVPVSVSFILFAAARLAEQNADTVPFFNSLNLNLQDALTKRIVYFYVLLCPPSVSPMRHVIDLVLYSLPQWSSSAPSHGREDHHSLGVIFTYFLLETVRNNRIVDPQALRTTQICPVLPRRIKTPIKNWSISPSKRNQSG